jgi:hypothetical protein
MTYLIGTVIFIFALGAMLIAFDAFMPKSYFDWMQRHRWGREVVGMWGSPWRLARSPFG